MSEPAAPPPPEEGRRRGARRLVATWPGRIAALAASAAVAWVVSQTLPALWEKTAEEAGFAAAPVQFDLVKDPDLLKKLDGAHNPEFVVQQSIEEVGPPPNGIEERGRWRWAKAMGGVDANATVLRLVLRGRTADPVILHDLEVEKVADDPPLAGTLLSYTGQGAGQVVRYFEIDLDQNPAEVQFIAKNDMPEVFFPYRITSSEVELFDIHASTLERHVKWRLLLHYSAADKDGTIVIDDDGRPFETTSGDAAHFWFWWQRTWRDQ